MKTCKKCKIEKSFIEFHLDKRNKSGVSSWCKACHRETSREAARRRRETPEGREASRETSREAKRRWLATPEGRKAHREATRRRRETPEGREASRKACLVYAKSHPNGDYAKRKNDPIFKMKSNICNLICISMKNRGFKKQSRTAAILGCTFDEFKLHIEARFTKGMTWENQGQWHYDHIKPISLAKTEEEVLVLNHYSNFQPLWAADNIRKGNSYANN